MSAAYIVIVSGRFGTWHLSTKSSQHEKFVSARQLSHIFRVDVTSDITSCGSGQQRMERPAPFTSATAVSV
jgi:hypothetical protein